MRPTLHSMLGVGRRSKSMHAAPRANEQQKNNRRSLLAALRRGAPPLAPPGLTKLIDLLSLATKINLCMMPIEKTPTDPVGVFCVSKAASSS